MLTDRSFSELFATRQEVTDPVERRGAPRIPLEVDVIVAAEGQFFTAGSADIAEGGIFVATYRVLPVGERVMLEFTLPSGQVLARGAVRWLRKGGEGLSPGIGIGFEDLSELDRSIIASFCGGRPRFYTYDEVAAAAH